jgi:LPXTG-site transpeptidase (sortase) family protein
VKRQSRDRAPQLIYYCSMSPSSIYPRFSQLGALAAFCALAALSCGGSAWADIEQSAEVRAATTQVGDRTYFFILDPWTVETVVTSYVQPDQSLWDATQIKDYEAALNADYPPPLGLLTINALNIQVPIFNGTDEHILDRGAGRIKGMAKTGEDGNLGISAHRDSFFRGLKDIELGEVVEVQTVYGVDKYEVSNINIVPKDDVSVLAPVEQKTLTLVTCYPFYHVGAAPERFIVTALPVAD